MSNQLDIDPLPYFSQVCENIRSNMKKQVMLKSNPEKVDETEIEKLRMEVYKFSQTFSMAFSFSTCLKTFIKYAFMISMFYKYLISTTL